MNIVFLGNFTEKKGSQLFAEVISREKVKKCNHKIHILGYIVDKVSLNKIRLQISSIHVYQEKKLITLLTKLKTDVVIIPSIWPETYSRTFFKAIELGYPTIFPKLGNPYYTLDDKYPLFYENQEHLVELLQKLNYDTLKKTKEFIGKLVEKDV